MQHIISAYRRATKRLFLLDYDGTLVDIAPTPPEAAPTAQVIETLQMLTCNTRNTVVIISGRDQVILDEWLGSKLDIGLSAEHGFFIRPKGGQWQAAEAIDNSWKQIILERMQQAVSRLPGSFVEAKQIALVWHYRLANRLKAEPIVAQLQDELAALASQLGLQVLHGKCVLEVKKAGFSKGGAAYHWLESGDYDFILAAGDDVTDEDLFAALPAHAYVARVGAGAGGAGYALPKPADFLELLMRLRS